MATFVGISVSVLGSPHAWWFAVRDDIRNHLLDETSARGVLRELLARASSHPKAPSLSVHSDVLSELWGELAAFIVEGWIPAGEVIDALKQLRATRRHLPLPKRVRDRWAGGHDRCVHESKRGVSQRLRRKGMV